MKPNILVLFTDDQRYNTIRALGNSEIHTPTLDRLVERGCTFTHAHIQGGTSGAVCMPSRAMLHSGRCLMRFPDMGKQLPQDIPTMGSHFQAHGYNSFGCGKWHNGQAAFNRCFNSGDAIFFGGMADHWDVPMHHYAADGNYGEDSQYDRKGIHSTESISNAAISFIQQEHEKPWFNYVSFLAPHDPRTMPQWFHDLYQGDDVSLPKNYLPEHPFDNGDLELRDELLEERPRPRSAIQRHLREYYAMISHLDFQIGRIFEALEQSGQAENTIIVFAGDNGLAVGSHGLMGKQNLYEHSTRVPLIFAGPGIPCNTRSDAFCYLFDIFPSLCAALELDTPDSVDGKNLLPVMQQKTEQVYEYVHTAYRHYQRAVRDQRWKLIAYAVDGQYREQLFDLKNDPQELHDLIDVAAHAAEKERLQMELRKWQSDWYDELEWGQAFWSCADATATLDA